MPTNWLVQYIGANGTWTEPVDFPSAAIATATRKLVNQGVDTCEILFSNARPPNLGPLSAGTIVRILRDDFDGRDGASNPVGWFWGQVVAPRRTIAGSSESATLVLNGPWWYLANIVYQQFGLFYSPIGTQTLSGDTIVNTTAGPQVSFGKTAVELSTQPYLQLSSDIILTQAQSEGIPMDAGKTLRDALNYAQSKGAKLIVGTMPADQAIPSQVMTDPTCADMVKRVLRWLPSVVAWFDYATDPPTINFQARADRPAVSLAMGEGGVVQTATLQARPDLVLPGVRLQFVRRLNISTTTGSTATTTTPATTDPATGTTTPAQTTTTTTPAPVSGVYYGPNPFGFQAASNNSGYIATKKDPGTTTEPTTGAITSTTTTESSLAVLCLQIDEAGDDPMGIGALVATVELQGGDLNGAADAINTTPFEPTPVGLAKFIYAARKVLSFEGSVSLKAADPVNIGNPISRVLNLTGGDDEWAAMAAEIQTATETTNSGASSLTLGPPNQLGPQDLAALLQANRLRQYVALGTSILRNSGGAALPPANPIPPSKPNPGGNGGRTGPSNAPAGGSTVPVPAGILTPYSGTYTQNNPTDGIYRRTGPSGNTDPTFQKVLPTFPGIANVPNETPTTGSAGSFYATRLGGGIAKGTSGSAKDTSYPFVSDVTDKATHSEGSLDLTGYSALAYSYAELRGTIRSSNADGSTTATDYTEDCTNRLGFSTHYRLYAPGGATFLSDQDSLVYGTNEGDITLTGLYLVPRTQAEMTDDAG